MPRDAVTPSLLLSPRTNLSRFLARKSAPLSEAQEEATLQRKCEQMRALHVKLKKLKLSVARFVERQAGS